MADNEIRNPAKAYFKWKMPVIAKSEDDWNFWNTEDKYNRTMFIGYNDTTTPHVASLFIIVDGKATQAVGDDVIARIAGLETNTAQALADIQALIDRVNVQQIEISNLQQECERILASANASVDMAEIWAEGTDEEVADLGGEHSAKGWAQKANDIVAAGLPSDVTFDHLTVTGSSKFGQDPDRANQPGLEIEGTGEIQAYRTVNMMNGATVSYDETVEMPWSDSSTKVPNTAWVQQAVQHGSIDPNSELTVKKITTTTGGGSLNYTKDLQTNTIDVAQSDYPRMELSSTKYRITTSGQTVDTQSKIQLDTSKITASATAGMAFTASARGLGNDSAYSFGVGSGADADRLYFTVYPRAVLGHGLLVGGYNITPVALSILRDAEDSNNWKAKFYVTPTVPDITNAADSSDKVPNTKWVQAAIAAGGGGGSGAVTSVNGKTGEVVLAATDVGAATTADITTALEPYAKTADVNTTLTDYAKSTDVTAEITTATAGLQPKLTAGANITISEDNVISATGGGTGGAVTSVNGQTGEVVLSASDVGAASSSDLASYVTTDAMNTELTNFATTASVDTKLADYQRKLIAGDGIAISESNVISVTGGTGGAVSSVNGKTGEVVLNATDVGAITGAEADTKITTALEPYAKTADVTADITAAVAPLATTEALTTGLAGKQDVLTAESDLSVNSLTSAKGLTSETGTVSAKKIQTVADTVYNADGSFNRVCLHDMVTKSGTYGYVTLNGDEIRINGKNSGKALTYLSSTGIYDTTAKPAADASNTRVGTTAWVQSAITAKTANLQPKLTAGTGIAISADNVISSTVTSAVDSVNGKTGVIVLTGEDVNVDTTAGAATVKAAITAKQDAITAGTDLDVHSLKAHYTATTPEGENQQYTMDVTGNGFELKDSVNNISCAKLTPLYLDIPSLTILGAPGVTTLLTCYGPAKIANISSIGDPWTTGAFNWDINTTTDYNKFEVYNLYFADDAETGQKVPNRSVLFSIGGSPDNHSTWIDFTANYLSFKGDANFGETGMNHNMNFNGPSTFNNEARFTKNVTLGHGETTVEGEGGTPTTTPASLVFVEGDLVANGNATFNKGLSASGTVHINNATFWREVGGGVIPAASYSYSTGMFNISYLTSIDDGNGANRVNIVSDSREASYGAVFNLPVTVSDASFKRTSTLAADDNSEEVPTTAWVKSAIASSGGSVPDDITCKTLKVTSWDSSGLDSIEFAGNLKYSGDYGNGSLGKITAREFFANSSGYYSTRVSTSGITLTYGSGGNQWFNADSSTRTITIDGTLKSSTPAAAANNTEVATTAWVNTAITAKAATKPTLTYAEKSGEPTVTKIEQCNGGSLCTIMWTGNVSTATGHVYIDLPTEFASAKIVSTQFTAHDTGTAAPWTADASISGGKIMLSVKSTAASSSASATIVLYKA